MKILPPNFAAVSEEWALSAKQINPAPLDVASQINVQTTSCVVLQVTTALPATISTPASLAVAMGELVCPPPFVALSSSTC